MKSVVLLLLAVAGAHALHHPAIPGRMPLVHRLRGGSSGVLGGDALISEKKVSANVAEWTIRDVEHWLTACGLGEVKNAFRHHQVDGSILLGLNEDRILRMGIETVAMQMKVYDAITHLQKFITMPERQKIKVPTRLEALWKFLSCRFLMTSEGKSGNELKDELINANSNMALVSALLLGVTMSWAFGSTNTCFCDKKTGANCFCSSGFDLDGEALWAFFSSSTIASLLFTGCTISAVVQIMAVQECSDEHEITVFFDKLGQDEVLCGPLMLGGIFFTSLSIGIYLIFNEKLGAFYNPSPWAYITCGVAVYMAVTQIPTWASIARKLYAAKLYAAWHPEKTGYVSGVEA